MSRRDAASTFRNRPVRATRGLLALAAVPLGLAGATPARAQQVVSVPVTMRVAPVARVEGATSPEEVARTAAGVEYRTSVRVSANVRWELRATSAREASEPVLVRAAGGGFEPAPAGTWLSVARRETPCDECTVEVVFRLPASAPPPSVVPLRFDLVAR